MGGLIITKLQIPRPIDPSRGFAFESWVSKQSHRFYSLYAEFG